MSRNRSLATLPAPRIFRTLEERLKYDQRVYDTMVIMQAKIDALTVSTPRDINQAMELVAASAEDSGAVEHIYIITDSYTINNSASEEYFDLDTALVIEAGEWDEGRAYRLHASGVLSTTSEPDITFRLRAGSQLLLSTGSLTILPASGSGVTDAPWWMDIVIACRDTGTSGSVVTNGRGFVAAAGMASALSNSAATTLDLSNDVTLQLSAQWSAASASNVVTLQMLTVEKMPAP